LCVFWRSHHERRKRGRRRRRRRRNRRRGSLSNVDAEAVEVSAG